MHANEFASVIWSAGGLAGGGGFSPGIRKQQGWIRALSMACPSKRSRPPLKRFAFRASPPPPSPVDPFPGPKSITSFSTTDIRSQIGPALIKGNGSELATRRQAGGWVKGRLRARYDARLRQAAAINGGNVVADRWPALPGLFACRTS